MSIPSSEFPPEFDPGVYRALHQDLERVADEDLREHYERTGRQQGMRAHALATRADLLAIAARAGSVLELYPGSQPLLTGPNISYFDVKNRGSGPVAAGRQAGMASKPVTYVSPFRDLRIIDRTFDVVVSSHAIEHVPDLTAHLQQVEGLLNPGGWYVAMIPDRRYGLDFFMPETTIGDVLEAAIERRRLHSARTLVNQQALRAHNEGGRHWAGDHGEPEGLDAATIEAALECFVESVGQNEFVDRHGWQFTDRSFAETVRLLNELRLISLPAWRIYPATFEANEFWAVLGPAPGTAAQPAATRRSGALQAPAGNIVTTGEGWGVDSVQPQPNLIVIRGWSDRPPAGVRLVAPELPPMPGMVQTCIRREAWAPESQELRESGFIAVFPLRRELTLDQYKAAEIAIDLPDETVSMRLQAVGTDRKAITAAANSLLKRWRDSVNETSRVLEVGARRRTADSIRSTLPGSYLGIDIVDGSGVDVIADAHLLSDALAGQTFTHAFSTSVFEHLFCPIQAASELNAVLEVGALAFIHSHQTWGYHEPPWDFFRFSDSAWRALFNEVTGFEVIETAMSDEAIIVPATEWGNPSLYRGSEAGRAYHTSVVLARKTGPSRLKRLFSAEELKRVYPGFYPD